jgi:membrane fusion protein (multidrug efflux system)
MTENMRAIIAKKTMQAPFDGIAGIRMVNVGQMVKAGDQIVPLQSLDPVYVDFALPQQRLADLSNGLEVNMHTDAFPGRVFHGTLTAINSAVDVATRNVTLQGTFPNADHVEAGNVRKSGRSPAEEGAGAGDSSNGDCLRALRRFGFCH